MFGDLNIKALLKNSVGLISISFVCSAITSIKGGIIFTPIIYGLYVCMTYHDKLRLKQVSYLLLPLFFFVLFITGGGMFLAINTKVKNPVDDPLLFALIGIWCSQLLIVLMWATLKIKVTIAHLITTAILILPPYLFHLNPIQTSRNSIFLFYFLWLSGFSISLGILLSQKTTSNLNTPVPYNS